MEEIKKKINSNPRLKWVLSIVGVVILGAIGSGVWQLIGEPIINFIIKFTIDGMDLVIKSYKDSLYLRASKGFHESTSTNTYVLLICLLPIIMAFSYLLEKAKLTGVAAAKKEIAELDCMANKTAEEKLNLLEESIKNDDLAIERLEKLLLLLLVVLSVMCFNSAVQQTYVNKTVTYVENTLDRLSPFVPSQEIISYRAQFREVKTAEDYYALYKSLEGELANYNLESTSKTPL